MATRRLAVKVGVATTLSLALLGVFVVWMATRPPVELAAPRAGDAPAREDAAPPGAAADDLEAAESAPSDVAASAVESVAVEVGDLSLGGVVLDPDATPVAGARIELEWSARDALSRFADAPASVARPAKRSAAAVSDAKGGFEFTELSRGLYDLVVTAPGFARASVDDAPAGESALRVFLERELFVRGEVVDADGKSIEGAEARVMYLAPDAAAVAAVLERGARVAWDERATLRARTSADGRFAVGGLARGAYRVEVDHPAYVRAIAPLVAVHESPSADESVLVFQLEEGHRITGVVRGAGGEPLGGARVRARFTGPLAVDGDDAPGAEERGEATNAETNADTRTSTPRASSRAVAPASVPLDLAAREPPVRSTRSRADGSFEVVGLPAGLYELVLAAPSHRDRTLADVAAGGEPLEVELAAVAPLAGVVVDAVSGEPLEDAAVSVLAAARGLADLERAASDAGDARIDRTAERTDRDGRFRIDSMPEGGLVLRAEARGYRLFESEPLDDVAVAAAGNEPLTLALERSGSVSGRAHAPPGSPLEGLRVSLEPHDDATRRRLGARAERPGEVARTDADGLYRVLLHDTGTYRVLVAGEPYVTGASEVFSVEDASDEVDGADVYLELAASVRGIVVAQDGRPVRGARVRVVPARFLDGESPREEGHAATADALGAYEVHGLPAGAFQLVAGAPGFIGARTEIVELAAGASLVVDIELEPEMAIAGIVISPEGEPIEAADIRAVVQGESGGEYWSGEHTISSTTGTFRLGRLANRPYDLRVTAETYAPSLLEGVVAGSDDVVVRLERRVSLSGKVIGEFSEEPAQQFRLRLQPAPDTRLPDQERAALARWRDVQDEGGVFTVDELPPGAYLVEVEAPRHFTADPVEVELAIDEGFSDLVIALREVGLIAGLVFDGRAQPVEGVRVEAFERITDAATGRFSYREFRAASVRVASSRSRRGGGRGEGGGEDGGEEGSSRGRGGGTGLRTPRGSTSDGRFFARDLPDGTYRLLLTHDDFVARELGDYTLENGSGGDVAVGVRAYLDSGATLLGTVRGLRAIGDGGLSVSLSPLRRSRDDSLLRRRPERKSARMDGTGRFEIRGLAVGEYVLSARYRRASDGSFASVRQVLEIHESDRQRGITIDLSR